MLRRGVAIRPILTLACLVAGVIGSRVSPAQVSLESEPIQYFSAPVSDRAARLQQRLEAGELSLAYDPRLGYLPAMLQALEIEPDSQSLVFSKTSFQQRLIAPETPRTIYFSDDAYVGWVRGGDVVEISAVDPQLGAVFYTLDQKRADSPRLERRTHECLQCHASTLTRGVPGHLVRSVFPDPSGYPILKHGSFVTTHESPLAERWGGWYVTGTHGSQRHLGNATMPRDAPAEQFDREAGANVTDLTGRLDTTRYLAPDSDLVALLVLEHQTHLHNLITNANYQDAAGIARRAHHERDAGRTDGTHSPTTLRRISTAGELVVAGLLFCGEPKLAAPLRGTSHFTQSFAAHGPRDRQGRSLRDFDLEQRLFQHPCSYLIYSEAFDGLPDLVKQFVFKRLDEILSGPGNDAKYSHLPAESRQAIREILLETKPDFAAPVGRMTARPQPRTIQEGVGAARAAIRNPDEIRIGLTCLATERTMARKHGTVRYDCHGKQCPKRAAETRVRRHGKEHDPEL